MALYNFHAIVSFGLCEPYADMKTMGTINIYLIKVGHIGSTMFLFWIKDLCLFQYIL